MFTPRPTSGTRAITVLAIAAWWAACKGRAFAPGETRCALRKPERGTPWSAEPPCRLHGRDRVGRCCVCRVHFPVHLRTCDPPGDNKSRFDRSGDSHRGDPERRNHFYSCSQHHEHAKQRDDRDSSRSGTVVHRAGVHHDSRNATTVDGFNHSGRCRSRSDRTRRGVVLCVSRRNASVRSDHAVRCTRR